MKGKPLRLDALLDRVFGLRYFHAEGKLPPAIPHVRVEGKSKLVVVVGPNAGGKSFFRRIVSLMCRDNNVECMAPSMQLRTQDGFARAFMYGDESWQSTGELSSHVIVNGIKTCRGRDGPHVIFWDEPDIGMSDGYAAGTGRSIAAFAREMPKYTVAAFVVTHNKALVRQLVAVGPHYIHLGDADAPPTLEAWLDTDAPILAIEDLSDASHRRFKRIQKILDQVKKEKGI